MSQASSWSADSLQRAIQPSRAGQRPRTRAAFHSLFGNPKICSRFRANADRGTTSPQPRCCACFIRSVCMCETNATVAMSAALSCEIKSSGSAASRVRSRRGRAGLGDGAYHLAPPCARISCRLEWRVSELTHPHGQAPTRLLRPLYA